MIKYPKDLEALMMHTWGMKNLLGLSRPVTMATNF